MSTYKVTLLDVEDMDEPVVVDCEDGLTILEAAADAGINLPYSCKAGSCSSCAGKIVEGTVNQEDQSFLDDDQLEENFVLTCIAYPQTDCVISTNQEDALE